MRPTLSAILVVLLATCPIVCGTADAHAPVRGEACDGHGAPGQSGLPAPANDDDCLCNGALKAGDTASDLGLGATSQPLSHSLAGFALATAPHAPVEAPSRLTQLRSGEVAGGARGSILRC